MKIRAIPFGYKYDVGQIIVDETAACIVKEIFRQYVGGKSLLNISSLLNTMCIEYRPGVVGWNKARVKRIIEDKRYLGNEDFPTIISEECRDIFCFFNLVTFGFEPKDRRIAYEVI